MTRIMKCDCKHKFQDKKYGNGKRVFNETTKTNPTVWRCTICGKEKTK